MECVLDEELLANIKRSDQEDEDEDDDDDEKMQMVEEQQPPVALNASFNGEDADPLQDSTDFPWIFEDSDVLLTEDQLAKEESFRPPAAPKRGRGRPANNSGQYTSASGQMWSATRDTQVRPQKGLPILGQQACGKGPARQVSNAVEAWMLLFDDEMLRSLLRQVNEQLRKRRTTTTVQRPLDIVELRAYLGLSYLCGVFRNARHSGPLEELWTLELGNAIFRASMTLARFESISECLAGNCGWAEGQKLWQRLLINCRSYYGCSSWLAVDEAPCSVAKSLMTLCCDARTLYMANAVVSRNQRCPDRDVEQLICDFKTTGRNVTLGVRHLSLVQSEQLRQRQISSLGLLETSSPDWPRQWSSESTVFSGSSKLIPLDGEAVFCCGLSPQVDALQAYQETSHACQQFHELSQRFSTAHATPNALRTQVNPFLQLLHFVLNAAAVNSWILLRLSPKSDAAAMEQRDFQRQLGLFLTQQRLQRRLQRRSTSTSLVMRLQICEILGQSSQRLLSEATGEAKLSHSVGLLTPDKMGLPAGVSLASRYGEKHRRCKPCARNKRGTKSRTRCQQCLQHRCGNHLISRCYECVGILPGQPLPEGNMRDEGGGSLERGH
ncbi:uncharacterized protein LOC128254001 [Drosophila gunungcola]|uniref:PiggyBac transposable element-derived protein domain-containing protein n=1 Tax=Drosophila gunungcola TaxID=103775 RepID=A0A9P9YN83_9MUSC|nr:uncharacterized protein LOC128254001 [Drosophila gunungcola]KAI8040113.1 hypothetical protein M5D96_007543 [Drosophila gunungcola]